jgi:hypothetical protein
MYMGVLMISYVTVVGGYGLTCIASMISPHARPCIAAAWLNVAF